MTSSGKKLATHASIYFAGNLLRRAVGFFMLPIYTRYLTTSDYGVIEMLGTVLDFVAIIVGLRVGEALFRFYSEYEDLQEKNEVISTGLFLVAALNIFGILAVFLFSKPLSLLLFDSSNYARLLVLFSFTLLGAALIEIPMAYLRALQRPWFFVFFSTLHLLIQFSLNIYFVVVKGMRVEGVVYGAVLSTSLMSIILLTYTIRQTGLSFSLAKARQLFSFSWPLIITSFIAFYIVFGDRYFLKFYWGLSEVGIYGLGNKFGLLISFVVNPFFNIWQSERYSIVKHDNAESQFHNIILVFSIILILMVVFLSITIEDILRVMAAQSFWEAHKVVPLLLSAYAFDALYNITNLGILIQKRTYLFIYGNLIAAAVITVGYIVLIPSMGAMGAAWATLCAYFVRFLWITYQSQKLYNLKIPWKEILIASMVGIFIYIFSILGPEEFWASIFYKLTLTIVFVVSLFLFPILPTGFRKDFARKLFHPKRIITYVRSLNK